MDAWEERVAELEFENTSLKHELNVIETDLDNISTELKEYHDFLESLSDFLIWDTGKRAREVKYKIEVFLKRMDNKHAGA